MIMMTFFIIQIQHSPAGVQQLHVGERGQTERRGDYNWPLLPVQSAHARRCPPQDTTSCLTCVVWIDKKIA